MFIDYMLPFLLLQSIHRHFILLSFLLLYCNLQFHVLFQLLLKLLSSI